MLMKSNQSKHDIENRQMQNKPFQETVIHVENNMYDYIKYYCLFYHRSPWLCWAES